MEEYVIMSPCKDEENYICEWIKYHLDLGFDKIYLYDNNDNSDILLKVLHSGLDKSYVERVIIYPIPGLKAFQKELTINFYNEHEFKWCAFIDCDEFITLTSHKNIKDYINSFPQECNTIYLQWLEYGSNNNLFFKKGNIFEKFKFSKTPIDLKKSYWKENSFVKSIVKKGYSEIFSNTYKIGHGLNCGNIYLNNYEKTTQQEYLDFHNYDLAYIKHFYVRDLIGQFLSKKCKQDAMYGDKVVMKRKISLMSETENNWLHDDLIEISNYSIENLKGKNVLITHEDILPFLLKPGYKITFCGDLKNNNKWINIANFNKCEYKWIKSEFFDQMYTKEDFDFVY